MSNRRPSNTSHSFTGPRSPMSGVALSTSTMGSRRRAAATASPCFVRAFSRTRTASSSAWKVFRSTILGAPSSSLVMSFIVLSFATLVLVELSRSCAAASLRLCIAPSGGGSLRVGYDIDPLRVSRGLGVVVVVPVPPRVRRCLGVTLWRILPGFLTAKRRDIEVAPGGPHRLVATVVDEVCAEHPLALAEEHVVAVPLIDAEVHIEAVGNGVPGHVPAHPRLQARDVCLRRA